MHLLVAFLAHTAAAGMVDVVGPSGMLESLPRAFKCGSAMRWILAFVFGGIFSRMYDVWKAGVGPRESGRCTAPQRSARRQDVKLEIVACASCTDDCPICLDPLGSFGAAARLPCGHIFHRDCIARWLDRGCLTCPVCRMDAVHPKLA